MAHDDPEEVEVIYQTKTDKAFCVRKDEEDDEDVWVPRSLGTIQPPSPKRGDVVTLTAPQWLLEDKGLA